MKFKELGVSIGTFTSGMVEMGGIGAGIGFLFGGPLGAAIGAGIGILIAGIINIVQNWDEFKKLISTTWDLVMDSGPVRAIKNLGKTISKFFAPENNALVAFMVSAFDFVSGFAKIFGAVVVSIGRFLIGLGVKVWEGIKSGMQRGASAFFNFLIGFLPENIPFIDAITDKLSSVRDGVKGLWDTVVANLKKAFGKIPDFFRGALNVMRSLFFNFAAKIQTFLAGAFKLASALPLADFSKEEATARAKARTFSVSAAALRGPSGRQDIQRLAQQVFENARQQTIGRGAGKTVQFFVDLKGSGFEGKIALLEGAFQRMLAAQGVKAAVEVIDKEITSSDEAVGE